MGLPFTNLFRKQRPLVGLDIGSSAVKAVELRPAGRGYRVAAYASAAVPPDAIVDGAIIDGTAVAEAIKRLFDDHGFKARDVAASLSGNAVIVKKISLPVMTGQELEAFFLGCGVRNPVQLELTPCVQDRPSGESRNWR